MSAGFRAGQANDGYLQINGTDILTVSSGVLGVKNTGAQSEVRLYCESNNAHYASLKSPPHSDFIGNVTFTLPGTSGSSGQVLQTDGSGNLSWVNQSGGGGGGGGVSDKMSEGNTEAEVVDTGSDGHFKVTTEGVERLRVTSTGNITVGTSSAAGNKLFFQSTTGFAQYIASGGTGNQDLIVGTSASEFLRITSGGNLGIGINPSFPIYTGTNDRTLILGTGSEDSAIQIHSGTSNYGGLYFGDATSGSNRYRGYIEFKHGTNDDFLRFGTAATERLRIGKDGQIGLGGANYGTSGQVLTSGGASGAVTWTTISGGGGSYGDSNVDNHLNSGGASSGQILSWNGSDYAWVADQGGSGGGGISDLVDDTTPQLGGNLDLNSNNITGTGTIPAANLTGTLPAISGASLTTLNASELDSGTIPDARFPATLPAASGTNLTNLPAANITGTLPAISGANLTNLPGISNVIEDTSPQLGGNLNVNGSDIISTSNGDIDFTPNGTGAVVFKGVSSNGGNGAGRFKLNCEANSHGITIQGPPHSAAANYTLTLPNNDGSSGDYLKSDGSGNLSWDTPSTPADTDVQVTYDISANGSSAYRFTGPGYSGADDNPDLYLIRGQRYRFINATGGHPFRIQSNTSGTAYTDGVSGSQTGTQDFNVQHDAPSRLYYQCTSHSAMIGNIYIVGASDWRMTNVATGATPEIYTNLNVGIGTDNPSELLHLQSGHTKQILKSTNLNTASSVIFDTHNVNTADFLLGQLAGRWNGTDVAYINFEAGADTTNKDDGVITFLTSASGGSPAERLRIDSLGSAQFKGQNAPAGLDTRISQYGSLLVATTGELISNARCSIDSGNGTITTAGNGLFAVNTSTYQTGINLHTSSNLSTLTVYSNNSSTHRSLVVYDNAQSGAAKYRAAIYANGSAQFAASAVEISASGAISSNRTTGTNDCWNGKLNGSVTSTINADGSAVFDGSIAASSANLQSSATSSWFQTGTSLASTDYVWAAKNSSSNTWHSGLQTDGDLYLGGNLAGTNNIALNGSNGSAWFTGGVGIGGSASANTMDEYEEGAYTPKLYAGTGTTEPAYSWRYGQYVRVGEVVHVWGALGLNGSVPSCTTAYIGNLPYNQLFDSNNFFHYTQLHGYTWASGYSDSGSDTRLFLQTANGYSNKVLIVNGANKSLVTHAMIGTNQRFTFQFSYVLG